MGQNLSNLYLVHMPNMGICFLAYNSAIFCLIRITIHIRVPETTNINYYNIQIYLESATFLIKFPLFFGVLLFLGCPTFFGLSYLIPTFFELSYSPTFFPEKVLDTLHYTIKWNTKDIINLYIKILQ